MSGQDDPGVAPHQQERAISSLIEATSVPPEEVRALFMREFAKLEKDARIRTHLQTLTTARVRTVLRRSIR